MRKWLLIGLCCAIATTAVAQQVNYSGPLKTRRVLKESGVAVDNTGISTSEVNNASFQLPPLAANDAIIITALWDTTGSTATNTKHLIVRLSAAGCTPLATCSTGNIYTDLTMNSASLVSAQTQTIIRNTAATNAQVGMGSGSTGLGTGSGATLTSAIETNAGGAFININSTTTTSTNDHVKLIGYAIELVPGS